MPTLDIVDKNGKAVSTVEVTKELLAFKTNPKVVRDAVAALMANRRRGTAHTKIKKEINFSGARPWRQKGTGRARAAERNSPLWRKGGVVFGPRNRDFSIDIPKKVKASALKQVVVEKLNSKSLIVVDSLELEKPKTKDFNMILENLKIEESALVVLAKKDEVLEKAARNLPNVKVVHASDLNTYDTLAYKKLVATKEAFEVIMKRLA
jgi:large subunit ribosomal protein L4